jgi:predicted transcriptional regulator
MSTEKPLDEAVEVLQQLGLKEYEAKCFVGLSQCTKGTAKQLSEMTDVPRTRVYDAIRVLEARGLVEIQHSSPQQFRAVPIEEATETLRRRYEDRVERLTETLEAADDVDPTDETPVQEIWTIADRTAIENRSSQIIDDAEAEVVLVIGDELLLTETLVGDLNDLGGDIDLLVGAVNPALEDRIQEVVPSAMTYLSGLEWLRSSDASDDVRIGRLLLVDRSTILVSTIVPGTHEERAVFGTGFRNGIVVIARRLLSQGLRPERDPQ